MLSLVWVILFVSLGAINILILLIRKAHGGNIEPVLSGAAVSLLGYLVFDEQLGLIGIFGFIARKHWRLAGQPPAFRLG